jgi:hypothetical protein
MNAKFDPQQDRVFAFFALCGGHLPGWGRAARGSGSMIDGLARAEAKRAGRPSLPVEPSGINAAATFRFD